ncbi:cellulase N-terminal Ig-like domain-containing protein [Puia sp. P3]|uniref:cellulase N-terminal Ig-like domain-containing protein n=1 Tax=Puia sp. P3 TaxID=3423952 RepID=UPI003D6674A5
MKALFFVCVSVLASVFGMAQGVAIHINQVVYPAALPKVAVVSAGGVLEKRGFSLVDAGSGAVVYSGELSGAQRVPEWGDSVYYPADFSVLRRAGTYRLVLAGGVVSEKFEIGGGDWARPLIGAILHYYNRQRANTPVELEADSRLLLYGSDRRVDLRGGWCDASGDVSKYFSHLAYANFMSPQQIPLVTWSLVNTGEALHRQLLRWGLADSLEREALWGADYLVRSLSAEGYFYMTVFSYFKKTRRRGGWSGCGQTASRRTNMPVRSARVGAWPLQRLRGSPAGRRTACLRRSSISMPRAGLMRISWSIIPGMTTTGRRISSTTIVR